MNLVLVRMLATVVLALLACAALAGQPEKPPKGHGKYLIVLWHPGTPVPGKTEDRMKKVREPDVAKLGGRVLASQANRRLVFLPYGVATQLRKHAAVSYIQRIWTGEDLSEWNEADGAASRPERIASDSEQFTWAKDYTYDADGNITRIGSTASGYDEFGYDAVGRLTEATVNGVPETYFYDGFGNLTGFGRQTGGRAIPVDPATNRLVGAQYDAAGNVTTRKERGSYVYDPLNMIVAYEVVSGDQRRILYDANDERIGMTDGSTTQRWTIRDFDGQILREFRGDDLVPYMVWRWEQDHIRGEGQLIAGETQTWSYTPDEENPSQFTYGGKRHYHLDHLGSVRIVTNQAGKAISENDFFPFGAARTKQYQEQLNEGDPHTDGMRFAGHWRDFMGHINVEDDDYLDYMHARYYDPHLGRFLSVDPYLDVKKALHGPQSWNRYSYVMNNPINRIDPDGRADVWFRVVRFLTNDEGKILGFIPVGKKLSMDQAVKRRQAGKSIEVTAKTEKAAYRAANEVENKAYPDAQNIHHGKDAHKRAGNQPHVQSDGKAGHSYYRTIAGFVLGMFIPMKVDAAIMLGEAGAGVAAEKGNEAIDKARKEAAFGGERRGEGAADEIIEPPP